MTRGKFLVAVGVTAWALGTAPAWAQRERGGGAETTGSASDRSSGGSSTSSGGGGSTTSSGGGSSSSSSSGGGYSAPSTPSSSSPREYATAPVRPGREDRETAQGRTPSNGSGGRRPSADGGSDRGGSRAVPRGSDSNSGSNGSRSAEASNGESPSRRAVPTYSRPSDGRAVTGRAVDRPAGYYPGGGGNSPIYYPTNPYGRYFYPGYGFGLGFYDLGWYDPYYYGSGYGYDSGYYGGGGGGYQSGSGISSYGRGPVGSLRLKIKPRDAQVFVDGYFVGVIDSFDGAFQRLGIDAGGHRIEIKAPGHEPISFDVLITPNETVTYKGELRRIQ
jgi:PEGA domain